MGPTPEHHLPQSPPVRSPTRPPRTAPGRLPSSGSTAASDRAELSALLLQQAEDAGDAEERKRIQEEVVLLNMGVARSLASQYRGRGVADEDLLQVACLGLVKAVAWFRTSLGGDFLGYAVPTIRGELKKHFRDCGWAVRPPRRVQDCQSRITAATPELTQRLQRFPRPAELAAHLDVDECDVIEALGANGCFAPTSLDVALVEHGDTTRGELLGEEDHRMRAVEARVTLSPLLKRLPDRERSILHLRFVGEWNQEQIGARVGLSQVQVSRLLSRILAGLKDQLG